MNTKNIIFEGICFLLALNFFYDGVYKFAYIESYSLWLGSALFLAQFKQLLIYTIPLFEVALSLCLIFSRRRTTWLYVSMGAYILFIGYTILIFQIRNLIFYPFHALWGKPTWIQVISMALFLSWLSFIDILYFESKKSTQKILVN